MIKKKYLNISEVSKMLNLEEHKIRYWDSIDPKTRKYRVEGISTKSKGGTRYFNSENISKLEKLKQILYEDGSQNYSIKLANKIISSNKVNSLNQKKPNLLNNENSKKIDQILNKMRLLLNNIKK